LHAFSCVDGRVRNCDLRVSLGLAQDRGREGSSEKAHCKQLKERHKLEARRLRDRQRDERAKHQLKDCKEDRKEDKKERKEDEKDKDKHF
jgi:hypothetical protein